MCNKCSDSIRNFVIFSHEMEIVQNQLNSTLTQVKSEDDKSQRNLSIDDCDDDENQNFEDTASLNESLLIPVNTPVCST